MDIQHEANIKCGMHFAMRTRFFFPNEDLVQMLIYRCANFEWYFGRPISLKWKRFFPAVFGRIMKNITNVLNVQFHSRAALFVIQTMLLLSYLIKSFELNFEHILLLFEHSFNMDISRSYTIAFMGLHLESEAGAFCALTKPFRKWFYLKWVELAECDNNPVGVCVLCSVRPKRDSLKTS